ncbi:MobA/MobL family protein [Propionispira raffinosivorans]|uniref:MobA/MobL family protein n=1 Tax=Propionispira raffinosivorans TaxID=86959 RepID=UPI0004761EBA|nr:MobA/MobL family protein [Propionispira raffinosivorans]
MVNNMAHYYFENTPHGTRKNGTKLNTKTHYDYIFREGEYTHMENRAEDLAFTAYGNMPSWADNPGMFWEEAEAHRDKPDGRAYRELRFALQEEFTLAENMELVEQLLKETDIKDHHAYSYAIHDKAATFDKDHRNIHCHLMFNEKIIENDRPLSSDKFFNHYATNRTGEPTQGYRSSREFITKEMTLHLRKHWAEMVNEKFQEKGLSTCISEKTLNAQREELALSEENEEAELLNRTPAPHLGSAYRNPVAMQKIMDRIKQTDHESDFPETTEEIDITSLSPQEQSIMIFANDALLRQVARQIQQEHLRLQKEQDVERAKIEAAEIMEEPFIITIADVYSSLEETASDYQKLANDKLAAYKALKPQVLNDQQLRLAAQDKAFNNQYDKTRKAYAKSAKELQRIKELATSLYGVPDKTHELAECSKKIKLLTEERNLLGKQLNDYHRAIAGDAKEKIDDIFKTLQQKNDENQRQSNQLYVEYLSLKKQADKYTEATQKLSAKNMDTILFTDKLPATLSCKCKIDGIQPISKLKILVYKGNSYALLKQFPPPVNPAKNIDNSYTVTAVKLGDNISRGTVPKHEIQVMMNNNNWKIQSAPIPIKNDSTPEIIRLYTPHESRQKNAASQKNLARHSHPILQVAHSHQKQIISSHISTLAKKLISKEKDIHLDAHWNDESEVKDKAKNAEDKIYQGWTL